MMADLAQDRTARTRRVLRMWNSVLRFVAIVVFVALWASGWMSAIESISVSAALLGAGTAAIGKRFDYT